MRPITFKQYHCLLEFGEYPNRRTAMVLIDAEDGMVVAKATVNLVNEDVTGKEVIVKDYSENTGMYDCLFKQGIVGPIKRVPQAGCIVCDLLIEPSN